jgi:hypothetical protein
MKAVLIDELLFHLVQGKGRKAVLFLETEERILPDPDEIPPYRGRLRLKAGKVPPVVNRFEETLMVDLKVRSYIDSFQFGKDCFIEESDLKEKILLEGFLIDAELLSPESDGCDPAALAVPPVVHLDGGFKDMTAAHRDVAGKPGDPASTLFCILYISRPWETQMAPSIEQQLCE